MKLPLLATSGQLFHAHATTRPPAFPCLRHSRPPRSRSWPRHWHAAEPPEPNRKSNRRRARSSCATCSRYCASLLRVSRLTAAEGGLRLTRGQRHLPVATPAARPIVPSMRRSQQSTQGRSIGSALSSKMPPADEGQPLTAAEIELLTCWVRRGGGLARRGLPTDSGPDRHLAWRQAQPTQYSAGSYRHWPRRPARLFRARRIRRAGMTPAPEADRSDAGRRVYLDLIGLPPSMAQVEAFVNDAAPGPMNGWSNRARRPRLWRALGPGVWVGHLPAMPIERLMASDPPAALFALSPLGDRSLQPQPAVRPVSRSSSLPAKIAAAAPPQTRFWPRHSIASTWPSITRGRTHDEEFSRRGLPRTASRPTMQSGWG